MILYNSKSVKATYKIQLKQQNVLNFLFHNMEFHPPCPYFTFQ